REPRSTDELLMVYAGIMAHGTSLTAVECARMIPQLSACHGAALWSQCGVGIRAPLEGRHIGASPRAA
ncbi:MULTISPECIES: hypothetical protein, partial [unclassified Burkholderia]|uniref:hypothetical protein n=1 Tax=unclassified Burkholderia TaxID=2613784 RepID=UPI0010F51734